MHMNRLVALSLLLIPHHTCKADLQLNLKDGLIVGGTFAVACAAGIAGGVLGYQQYSTNALEQEKLRIAQEEKNKEEQKKLAKERSEQQRIASERKLDLDLENISKKYKRLFHAVQTPVDNQEKILLVVIQERDPYAKYPVTDFVENIEKDLNNLKVLRETSPYKESALKTVIEQLEYIKEKSSPYLSAHYKTEESEAKKSDYSQKLQNLEIEKAFLAVQVEKSKIDAIKQSESRLEEINSRTRRMESDIGHNERARAAAHGFEVAELQKMRAALDPAVKRVEEANRATQRKVEEIARDTREIKNNTTEIKKVSDRTAKVLDAQQVAAAVVPIPVPPVYPSYHSDEVDDAPLKPSKNPAPSAPPYGT